MDDYSNLSGRILIPPKNRMAGKVSVIGIGSAEMESSITVTRFTNLYARLNVYTDEIVIDPSYPPVKGNQRRASIGVKYRSNLIASIKIPPKNRMMGMVEIIEPPTYTAELESIKDSFVRSQIPTLNYGDSESMLVGYNNSLNEAYRSFVAFNMTQMPDNAKIESVTLKLFNNQINSNTSHQVGVYTASTDWQENGITWVNQPAIKEIIGVYPLGAVGYTDIDVTDIALRWAKGLEGNYGFIVKAMSEVFPQRESYSTRESLINKPILEVKYKMDVIYSVGRSNIPSTVFVNAVGESILPSSITVNAYDTSRELRSRIHVRNFNYMLEGSLIVNRRELHSSLTVERKDESTISSSIVVRVKGGHLPQDNLQSRIVVNKRQLISRLRIRRRDNEDIVSSIDINPTQYKVNNIVSSINVRVYQHKTNSLSGLLVVNKRNLKSSIAIKRGQESDLVANLKVRINKNLNGNLVVNRRNLVSRINVKHYSEVVSSITVKQYNHLPAQITIPKRSNLSGSINIIYASHLPSSIQVLSGYLRASIRVPAYAENSLLSKMTVKQRGISELHSSINVGGDNILGGFIFIL